MDATVPSRPQDGQHSTSRVLSVKMEDKLATADGVQAAVAGKSLIFAIRKTDTYLIETCYSICLQHHKY